MRKTVFQSFIAAALILIMTTAFVPAVSADNDQSSCGSTYVVQYGDWMVKIANKCGVTYAALLSANPQIITPWLIYPGQVLTIPAGSIPQTGTPVLSVTPNSGVPGTTINLAGAGFQANTNVHLGLSAIGAQTFAAENQVTTNANGQFTAQMVIPTSATPGTTWQVQADVPGQTVKALANFTVVPQPGGATGTYVVQYGDTLRKIAANLQYHLDRAVVAEPADRQPQPDLSRTGAGGSGSWHPEHRRNLYRQGGRHPAQDRGSVRYDLDGAMVAEPADRQPQPDLPRTGAGGSVNFVHR